MKPTIRIGVDSPRAKILALNVPILVSANSLWDGKKFGGFARYIGKDVALDSSGFVAMKLYGGYRWNSENYVSLAASLKPKWWAQMDFCCEPEIAASRSEIEDRIEKTIFGLKENRASAVEAGYVKPMPVLQGFEPSDYVSGPLFDEALPKLIGVGSVCRRHLRGKNGLMAVIDAIDRRIPKEVVLHLFGVKGSALRAIVSEFSYREFSADSMAYCYAARWDAWKNKKSKNADLLVHHAKKWLDAQNQPEQTSLCFNI